MSARDELSDYDDDYLMCRWQRHHFTFEGFYRFTDEIRRKWIVAESTCNNCGTDRRVFFNTRYERQFARYIYPEGYRFHYAEGEPRVSTADLARAISKRVVTYKDRESLMESLGETRQQSA